MVTVWVDAVGPRRMVSLTDPRGSAERPGRLRRRSAASDAAVLRIVATWLRQVGAEPGSALAVVDESDRLS